jgi:hypothetical protein
MGPLYGLMARYVPIFRYVIMDERVEDIQICRPRVALMTLVQTLQHAESLIRDAFSRRKS